MHLSSRRQWKKPEGQGGKRVVVGASSTGAGVVAAEAEAEAAVSVPPEDVVDAVLSAFAAVDAAPPAWVLVHGVSLDVVSTSSIACTVSLAFESASCSSGGGCPEAFDPGFFPQAASSDPS